MSKFNDGKQRYVNTKFWNDSWVINLNPIDKLLFLYLLTNNKTNVTGVYELPLKVISFETDIDIEIVRNTLEKFLEDKKIVYKSGWIIIVNFLTHQNTKSKSIKQAILRIKETLPSGILNIFSDIQNALEENKPENVITVFEPNDIKENISQ